MMDLFFLPEEDPGAPGAPNSAIVTFLAERFKLPLFFHLVPPPKCEPRSSCSDCTSSLAKVLRERPVVFLFGSK